jgi:putative ABC transport system permease protein
MKYLPLVWAGLMRKPARSAFTLLSVVVAFLLFGLLQGINAGYSEVIEAQHLDRLLTDPRVPGGAPMPVAAVAKIEKLPGVTRVCGRSAFFGYYQDPRNGLFALATDPVDWFAVRPEYEIPAAQLAVLKSTRSGIVMTPALRDRLKLKLGDKVPVQSPIARKDGNPVWTFELVGSFDDTGNAGQAQMALINYDYFDEARGVDIGTVDRIIVRIADPARSAQTAALIDQLFANSTHETRTQNEKEQTESYIKQLGDIGFFTNAIVSAVFFTLLFVTGNTMVQSVRERIPEFAVLRTVGFPGVGVLALVLAEATLLCMLAAGIGLAIAAALFPTLHDITGLDRLSWIVVIAGMAAAVLLALISALLPAWRVKRLRIVDALGAR